MVSIFFRGLQFVFILHTNSHIQSDQSYISYHIASSAKTESGGLGKLAEMHIRISSQTSETELCVLLSKR